MVRLRGKKTYVGLVAVVLGMVVVIAMGLMVAAREYPWMMAVCVPMVVFLGVTYDREEWGGDA